MKMEQLTIQLSNAMQIAFLLIMVFGPLVWLTDGREKPFTEKLSLLLISIGAFIQLFRVGHPEGTSLDVLITHAGVVLLIIHQAYKYVYKQDSI